MPVVQVTRAPSRAVYEKVGKHLNLREDRPKGLILHSAVELPNGEVEIVDVYESVQALGAFGEQRILPAFKAADVQPKGPQPVAYEPFEFLA